MNGPADSLLQDALTAADAVRRRRVSALELTEACLARISRHEDTVHAWAHLDADLARQQARAADATVRQGARPGPLHGVPVGIKDIFDTADLPTENGTPLDAGRRPDRDALVVEQLREAGAIVLGKTVTAEMATYTPGPTVNPRDPSRTPGGSSSGSAAAVAAGMVPLALGTQTNGSVIRPAAYCGVVGFKPTRGTIARNGVLMQSDTLDQVGVFAKSVADAAFLAERIMADDPARGDAPPLRHPDLLGELGRPLPAAPHLAFARSPVWEEAEPSTRDAFERLAGTLAGGLPETGLPAVCSEAVAHHRTIGETELARAYESYYVRGRDRLSPPLRGMIERGRQHSPAAYEAAMAGRAAIGAALQDVFSRFEALVTPATAGEAPLGLESTGSPIFCTLWTLCGLPCITLPLLTGPAGLPLGVQLVGPFGGDAELLRIAAWLVAAMREGY